jgi:hypothetical protein
LLQGLGKVFSANPTTKFRNFAKISAIFSGFSLLCNKISFGELTEVLFELFPLNKFVFNTLNKKFSQAVSLCSAVVFLDAIGPTVYLLQIYF